jgi:LmbE family N-acetylglucosaminyl deacetylase
MDRSILVIAAHPDDEVLGCGATIAKHTKSGDSVHVVILAEGITGRDDERNREKRASELNALANNSNRANAILGVVSLTRLDFPDNRMDSLSLLDLVKTVEGFVEKYQPDMLYTHHVGDLNIDHKRTHEAVVTACRPRPLHSVRTILFFEVASSTEWQIPGSAPCFTPNWFVDVSDTLDLKLRALEEYETEMQSWPHARSVNAVEHLAGWRGATIGVEAAEAFILGRNLSDLKEPGNG